VAQVAHRRVRAVAVRLVDHEDVADLEDPGLGGLDPVAHPRCEEHDGGVGETRDVDLALTHPDRLDDDDVTAGGIEDPQRLRSGPRHSPEMAAAGHRTDVDLGVQSMLRHPDPVPEERPTGEGRARVDGEHADPSPAAAER
jgi:hypothetical protein